MHPEYLSPPTPSRPDCPDCGEPLNCVGQRFHCAAHGLFFRYGPRLLIRVPPPPPPPASSARDLLPWQTYNE
jgi:hypothetical protein